MNIVEDLPYAVQITEHVWIEMKDGTRLSARLWIPEGAEDNPVPAVFEYIPYRKRDLKRKRDEEMHGYFSGHGYACVRVDIRGSGESEGVLEDEYTVQELEDGCEILKWIGEQPWCTGDVGMVGISWGGFNGLQIAAMQPPELKAVISVASTDDRYADDIHYMGGCMLGDHLSWASIMFSYNSLPPSPEIVGENWRDMWRQRLEGSGLWLEKWLRHQRRDEFWKHGSVCEDYSDIQCPVMAVSGWTDGYSNSVFRLMEHLDVPRHGLVGPWAHAYPHNGIPGPAIGFLQECMRWWDHWLKGEDNGITEEPLLRTWMQEPMPPQTFYESRPGRWVAEESWPSPHIKEKSLHLSASGQLTETADKAPAALSLTSPAGLGLYAGKWCSYAEGPDLPGDQRYEDGGALVFDSHELREDIEILGAPVVTLKLESDQEVAMVAVRLSDVAPDGAVTRVSYGLLNLSHRDSHEKLQALKPGETYEVRVQLNDIAHHFARGHRIRVALSTSYWPLAWLPPKPVTLTFKTEDCHLSLPVRVHRAEDDLLSSYQEPEKAMATPVEMRRPENNNWAIHTDLGSGQMMLEITADGGIRHFKETGVTFESTAIERYSHNDNDFTSARGETIHEQKISRENWNINTTTRTIITCDETHFYIKASLEAREGDDEFFTNEWDVSIERDLV